ncbi:MAG TPA: UDP-N-acetylmuramoylalanyl-D-glutamyl-2,6-diaminopimelate--D-alanyl-D-alanine ligase [Hyphomicrobiaceae bacterium]|nr:UDP-N-acetylmuramoylalanyl-D-glutamyl-2,6-diaminopimelate--D-alanyl-D-alanine ligase [Hyphomicrobiaceae bacterium]
MLEPLWQWVDLVAAAQGHAEGTPKAPITGFSIDTRTLQPGDVFVALKDKRDGHDFVGQAFAAGAVAALVSYGYPRAKSDGALLRADDPLEALAGIGRAARARSNARIAAITGSAGKTGTKEMLRLCLETAGPTHASEKSYNNHWGVPLTLARMPQIAAYGVLEIGMNHAGEIAPLAQLVRPHVVVITAVEPVHLGQFKSIEEIAEAKAEILQGLVPGGTAILPRDNAHFPLLRERAAAVGASIVGFGLHEEAEVRGLQANLDEKGSSVIAGVGSKRFSYRVGAPGEHYVKNSLAVLAALNALGVDAMRALPALARIAAPAGRGARTVLDGGERKILLIDESYNANPASVRAALAAMATTPREAFPRRVAVLGDMLELGEASAELHRGLKEAVDAAGVDLVLATGAMMKLLLDDLATAKRGSWAASSTELVAALLEAVRPGDVVMIKGSLGTNMAPLVEAMLKRWRPAGPGG